ncbi:MAG: zf-HC2 domain-containing protein [Armatimonadetes bacterium]|nr:zf-HC2 domain-containing protein [Armatimonadota bacterium]NLN91101.1 hypothetical protein [candidate division WS1 bacterium]
MKCSEAERLMDAILDGDLNESPRLESHMAGCEACVRRWEALRRTVADLASVASPPVPERITRSVMAALAADTAAERSHRVATLMAACAMVLAALVGIGIGWSMGLGGAAVTLFAAVSEASLSLVFDARDSVGIGFPGYVLLAFVWAGVMTVVLLGTAAVGKLCAYRIAARRGAGDHESP